MEVIKYGKLFAKKSERKYYAQCTDCGTKVKFRETELLRAEDFLKDEENAELAKLAKANIPVWKCPFCEHINKIKSFEDTFKELKTSAMKIGTVVFFPIVILVCMIIGVADFIKKRIDDGCIKDIIKVIGYIFGILLVIGMVAGIIGFVVASFKFGYYSV